MPDVRPANREIPRPAVQPDMTTTVAGKNEAKLVLNKAISKTNIAMPIVIALNIPDF